MSKIIDAVKTINDLVIEGTTPSVSTNSGALIVQGGVGIAKNTIIGGELYVDKVSGTTYSGSLKQYLTPIVPTATAQYHGTMSGDGLWMHLAHNYLEAPGQIWGRTSTDEEFTLYQSIINGVNIALNYNGEYLVSQYGGLRIWSRNLTTNLWTVDYYNGDGGNGGSGSIMSNDGLYVIFVNQFTNGVTYHRRTPGTHTWTNRISIGSPLGISNLIYGLQDYAGISDGADRIAAHSRTGFTVYKKTSDTTWVVEQETIGWSGVGEHVTVPIYMNNVGDLVVLGSNSTDEVEVYERVGVVWSLVYTFPAPFPTNFTINLSADGNRLIIGTDYYRRIANDNWEQIYTNTIPSPQIVQLSFDGSILLTSKLDETWIHDITNEVSFDQLLNVKTINFNDSLRLTYSAGSVDHTLRLPPFNRPGLLTNDGVGNCTWDPPFNQSLNTGDAVQFDSIGITPNIGQILVSAQLQLSMRLINASYTGDCVQVRRDTDFVVDYLLAIDLSNSASLAAAATYNSTGGTSGRGQFTATLAVSEVFTVDGAILSSANNGTRILLVGQTVPSENGIWTTTILGTSLTLNRAIDYDSDIEASSMDSFGISLGTSNGGTGQVLTNTSATIILGGAAGSDLTFGGVVLTQDIGFNNGIIDISALSLLISTNNGYISIWYDQSGNANNFAQTVESSQPRILLSGGINWLPTVSFDGVDDYLDAGDVLDISTNVGWYVNLVVDSNVDGGAIISKSTDSIANRWGVSYTGGNFDLIYEDTVDSTVSTAQVSGDPQIISLSIDRTPGTQTINSFINNTIINTNVPITNDNTYDFNSTTSTLLGAIDNVGLTYATGYISEVIIHNFAPTTSERVGLEQDQSSFYDITIVNLPKVNLTIAPTIAVDYNLVLPATQGSINETLINDGSGNLSWGVPTSSFIQQSGFSVNSVSGVGVTGNAVTWLDLTADPTYIFSSEFSNTGTAFRPEFTYSGAGGTYQFQIQFIFRGNTGNDLLTFELKKNVNTLTAMGDSRFIFGKDINDDHNINVKWIFTLATSDYVSAAQYSMNSGASGSIRNVFYSIKRLA